MQKTVSLPAATTRSINLSFWFKLAAFALPFAFVVLILTGGLVYIGESMPLALVVRQQMGSTPVLYRPQYGSQDINFKTLSINMRQPEVVAIGSSRVLQFRAGLLTENPGAFYNAGGPAWQLSDVRGVLQNLTTTPEVLILGVDYVWFNAAYEPDELTEPLDDFNRLFASNRSVMQAVFEGKSFDLNRLLARQNPGGAGIAYGLRAITDGHGFRNDGSEQYGDFLVGRYLHQPTERERHIKWMRNGREMYVYGDTLDADALAEFNSLLAWCKERGITVIGFAPPFTPSLYNEMMQRGQHSYMQKPGLDSMFAAHGFTFFDFSDGGQFGSDDDFYDGWHGSERVYLRLYMHMVEALPDVLGQYSNVETLHAIDAGVTDTWRVFGE